MPNGGHETAGGFARLDGQGIDLPPLTQAARTPKTYQ